MGSKLGQMLIKAGRISAEELDEALKCQVIFGGKLGTNLIEMGLIDEEELSKFLGVKLGLPTAEPELLMNIPQDIINLISVEIAEKYKVLPIKLENKRLSLVMADTTDLAAIDAISFMTGFIIQPHITPELRLIHCLEKYYGIKREIRYLNLSSGSSRSRKKTKPNEPANEALVAKAAPPPPDAEKYMDFSEFDGFDKLPEIELVETVDEELPPVKQPPPKQPPTAPPHVKPTPAKLPAAVEVEPYSNDQLATDLVAANSRDDIAAAVIRYAEQEFSRTAFFVVKGNSASGWQGVLNRTPIPDFEALQIGFDSPSLLKMVAEQKNHYLGPVPNVPMNSAMLAAMGGAPPPAALLMPLVMMGRVVAVLYVDGDPLSLSNKLKELQRLMAKTSLAFEILILKNKILMT